MFKKFKKSILTALVAAIALPLILALYLLLPKNNTITVQAEEAQTVSTAEELSTQLSASDTVTVQLISDISSTTTFTVSGVKTLDLNGYVVTFTGETGSVISVADGAEFTLKDSNPTKENTVGDKTVNGGVITGGKSDNGGGGVYVSSNAHFTMEGGNVSGNTSTAPYYIGGGGGVCVGSDADFTMKAGSISNNKAVREKTYDPTYGGGVYVKNGSFTMEYGAISGNVSQLYGGGVYVENGSFTMEDGSISGNKFLNDDSGLGGGVCVYENGKFTMNGGIIGGSTDEDVNHANYGGGVYIAAAGSKFKMTDSEISGNKASCGGGIFISSGAEVEISGGALRNNIAFGSNGGGINISGSSTVSIVGTEISGCVARTAGGIYIDYGATANMTDVTITGCSNSNKDENGNAISDGSAIYAYGSTVKLTGGIISGNKDGAAIFWVGPEFTISGAPYIYGNEDGDLVPSGPMYTINNLEEGAKIGITGTPPTSDGVFTTGGGITEDNIKCFDSNAGKCIKVLSGEAYVSSDDHVYSEPVWAWTEDCTSATATFTCSSCQHVETVTASGEDITKVTTPATCTSAGETTYTATVTLNGDEKTDTKTKEAASLPHDYANSTKYNSDDTHHWKICKDCTAEDTANKTAHSGGTATCTEQATCSACNAKYGTASGHGYDKLVVTTQPTNKNYTESDEFDTAGMTVYVHCGACGDNVSEITDYTVVYENGNELHHGDTKVTVQATVDGALVECEVTGLTVSKVQSGDTEGAGLPWWVWLLIVLCVLAVLVLILLLILRRKSEKEGKKANGK